MEDKKREGSLPRTLAFPNFSPEKLVNGLHVFASNLYVSIVMVTEYPLKEEHEK
jgi:hypothetical protein